MVLINQYSMIFYIVFVIQGDFLISLVVKYAYLRAEMLTSFERDRNYMTKLDFLC